MYTVVAAGDRSTFDRVTLRPRMMSPALDDMDLIQTLLGQKLFAPILVGPVDEQRRFHPDGELGTAKGAAAANAQRPLAQCRFRPLSGVHYANDFQQRRDAGGVGPQWCEGT